SWDTQHNEAETNGVRLHYITAGSGAIVLDLHGWPETHREYVAQDMGPAMRRGVRLSTSKYRDEIRRPASVVEADLSGVFSKLQRPGTTAPDPVGGRFQQRSDRGHRHRHSQADQERINQDDQALSNQRPPQTLASVGSSDLRYVSYACAEAGQQLRALIAVAEHGPCAMPDQAERLSSSSCLAVFDVTTKPWRLLRASVAMLRLTIPMTSPFRLNMGPPELPASMVASAWKNSARGMVRYAVLGAQRALMEPTLSE